MKVLEKNGQVIEGNFEEKEVKEAFWHTSAHVLAQAVKRLYPDTKCAIGPAIDNGFYYDFDFSFPFTEEYYFSLSFSAPTPDPARLLPLYLHAPNI